MEDIFYMNRSMPFLGENIVPNLYVILGSLLMYISTERNRIDRESVHKQSRATSYQKFVYFS